MIIGRLFVYYRFSTKQVSTYDHVKLELFESLFNYVGFGFKISNSAVDEILSILFDENELFLSLTILARII